jgi:hypothetical protein
MTRDPNIHCLKLLNRSGAALRTARNSASTSPGEARPKWIDQSRDKRAMALKFLNFRMVRAGRPRFPDSDPPCSRLHRNLAGFGDEAEADLPPACQFDIDLRKELRVEQCAVLDAVAAVDAEAHAQGIKAMLGARMPRPRQSQSIDHTADGHSPAPAPAELMIEEAEIE